MVENRHLEAFGKPFPSSDISWRMQYVDKAKSEGFAVPYLDARAISDRLDEVVGQYNWKDDYETWHCYTEESKDQNKDPKSVNSQLCTIYIYDEERKEWIGKTDGAENTDFESIKGGISDSFKRCAVKWNIGRYLYKFEPVWVKAKARGRAYLVSEEEKERLEKFYNDTVIKIFGKGAVSVTQGVGNADQSSQTKAPVQKNVASNAQPQQGNPTPQSHPVQNQGNPAPQQQPTQQQGTPEKRPDIYEIKSVHFEGSGETVKSTLVLTKGGKDNTMFMYGQDPKLKMGTKLMNLRGHQQKNSYGTYLILEGYDIAA